MSNQRIQEIDEQLRREHEARDTRRRLAEIRASLPTARFATLGHRAEEALANARADSSRLRYDVLVKMKMDELIEWECVSADMSDDGGHVEIAAA